MKPLVTVFLTVLIDLLGFGIIIPLLPIYSKAYGASEVELGLLFSCFSGMQLVFAPLWGKVSDRIGRRPVLLGGLVGTGLSYLLFAQADSMTLLFVSRLLAGFFGANIATAHAYVADVTRPEERAKGMGMIGAAFGIGFTIGPLVGGELTRFSTAAPGYAACLLSLAAATFGWRNLPEPARTGRSGTRLFGFGELRHAAREPRIGGVMLLYFLAIFAFSCFEAMFTRFGLAAYPAEFGVPVAIEHATLDQIMAASPIAGRYLAFIGVISALIQGGFIRRLVPRFGETALAVAGPLLLGSSFLIVGAAGAWWLVIVGCAVMPFGLGINNPSMTSLTSRASPPEAQGAYLGINQSLGSLARMTGPPAAGWFFQAHGPHSPFFFAAAVLGGATVIAFLYHRRYAATFPRVAPTGARA